jgi:pyrimidine deaminase RibD-like protein
MAIETEQTLDAYLSAALARLQETWNDTKVGLVAAALVAPDGAIFTATSIQLQPGRYIHAERAAIQLARSHGLSSLAPDAIMAVTLSPCIRPLATRDGPACVELLLDSGIRRVHVGVIDPKQGDAETYEKLGLKLSVTRDKRLSEACNALLGVFTTYGNQVNTNISGVKKELGAEFLRQAAA